MRTVVCIALLLSSRRLFWEVAGAPLPSEAEFRAEEEVGIENDPPLVALAKDNGQLTPPAGTSPCLHRESQLLWLWPLWPCPLEKEQSGISTPQGQWWAWPQCLVHQTMQETPLSGWLRWSSPSGKTSTSSLVGKGRPRSRRLLDPGSAVLRWLSIEATPPFYKLPKAFHCSAMPFPLLSKLLLL